VLLGWEEMRNGRGITSECLLQSSEEVLLYPVLSTNQRIRRLVIRKIVTSWSRHGGELIDVRLVVWPSDDPSVGAGLNSRRPFGDW
jgi:hypothetical protein